MEMLVEGAEFHEGAIPVERNAGPAVLADEDLNRVRLHGLTLMRKFVNPCSLTPLIEALSLTPFT